MTWSAENLTPNALVTPLKRRSKCSTYAWTSSSKSYPGKPAGQSNVPPSRCVRTSNGPTPWRITVAQRMRAHWDACLILSVAQRVPHTVRTGTRASYCAHWDACLILCAVIHHGERLSLHAATRAVQLRVFAACLLNIT